MASEKYDSFDIPAVGEIRAREGTATYELAGAVKHWHDKYKSAWIDGAAAGGCLGVGLGILFSLAYYYLRSH